MAEKLNSITRPGSNWKSHQLVPTTFEFCRRQMKFGAMHLDRQEKPNSKLAIILAVLPLLPRVVFIFLLSPFILS